MPLTSLSVIICSKRDADFAHVKTQMEKIFSSIAVEVIRVPDATTMSEGYNRGWRAAKGDWVIFCHDDITFLSEDFFERFRAHCGRFDLFGLVGTTRLCSGSWFDAGKPFIHGALVQTNPVPPHGFELQIFDETIAAVSGVQAVDGYFIAVKRRVVDVLQGFDEKLCGGFDMYDIEFCFRAHLAGFHCGIAGDLLTYHRSSEPISMRPPERQAEWAQAKAAFDQKYARYLSPKTLHSYDFIRMPVDNCEVAAAIFGQLVDQRYRDPAS